MTQQPEAQDPPPRTVLLIRHGRSTANGGGILAGRSQGVGLDETGSRQADAMVQRLAGVPIARIVTSPLERCVATLGPLVTERQLTAEVHEGLAEVDYGEWTGRKLTELAAQPLWRTVQTHASAAVFPGGEAMSLMAARSVGTVRGLLADTTGAGALVICTHGDVIKSILADALGLHLDQFQRISVAPASVSVVRYTLHRPFVELLGDTGNLTDHVPSTAAVASTTDPARSDAVPGGGTGLPAVAPAVATDP